MIAKHKSQCDKYKPFTDNFIWKIFINLALGIQYLHGIGIVHRDLKTLNIFMMKEKDYAKLGDFGCVLILDEEKEKEESKSESLNKT